MYQSLLFIALLASVANAQNLTTAQALARADAYIAEHRRGDVSIRLHGATPGESVSVSLVRHAFRWGGAAEGGPLNTHPTAADARYQAKFRENFNTVATNGSGMWAVNDQWGFDHLEWIREWAAANDFGTHFHTLLYDQTDPDRIDDLKRRARTSTTARSQLLAAVADRTASIFGQRNRLFDEMQVYNESLSTGDDGDATTYWNLLGPAGIAKLYADARTRAESIGARPTLYVNDCWLLERDASYVERFLAHVDALQTAGHGQVVGGLGLQFYGEELVSNWPARFAENLDRLAETGLPLTLTEFGAFDSVPENVAAERLDQAMRLFFGHKDTVGFTIWDWVDLGDGEQWAPGAALYRVTPGSWNNWQLTPAGQVWQDRLGIRDWDGDPSNAWTTQLTLPVSQDGTIDFNGYYGDYEITINNTSYSLSHQKGIASHALGFRPGDLNLDGSVDAAVPEPE